VYSSEEIKQRNFDEGRSYRNILEFTETGFRFKNAEILSDIQPSVRVADLPEGSRTLGEVYKDLGIVDEKGRKSGFDQFMRLLYDGMENVPENKRSDVIEHVIGGLKVAKTTAGNYLTPEGADLFKAYFTQSHTQKYHMLMDGLRHEELQHQQRLKSGEYRADPLSDVCAKYVSVPAVAKDEKTYLEMAHMRGAKPASFLSEMKEYLARRVTDEALLLHAENSLEVLAKNSEYRAQIVAMQQHLAARYAPDAPRMSVEKMIPAMQQVLDVLPTSSDRAEQQSLEYLKGFVKTPKRKLIEQVPADVVRQAEVTIRETIGGVRKTGQNAYGYAFTAKGVEQYIYSDKHLSGIVVPGLEVQQHDVGVSDLAYRHVLNVQAARSKAKKMLHAITNEEYLLEKVAPVFNNVKSISGELGEQAPLLKSIHALHTTIEQRDVAPLHPQELSSALRRIGVLARQALAHVSDAPTREVIEGVERASLVIEQGIDTHDATYAAAKLHVAEQYGGVRTMPHSHVPKMVLTPMGQRQFSMRLSYEHETSAMAGLSHEKASQEALPEPSHITHAQGVLEQSDARMLKNGRGKQ